MSSSPFLTRLLLLMIIVSAATTTSVTAAATATTTTSNNSSCSSGYSSAWFTRHVNLHVLRHARKNLVRGWNVARPAKVTMVLVSLQIMVVRSATDVGVNITVVVDTPRSRGCRPGRWPWLG
jgi:hypothetical protein